LIKEWLMDDFTIVFAGDTSLGDWYLQRAEPETQARLHQDPLSFFAATRSLIDQKDVLVLNLETVLAESPVSELEGKKKYLGWDQPKRTVEALNALNVDAVSLANNHTMDFGGSVLADTVAHLKSARIDHFGAGKGSAAAGYPFSRRIFLAGREKNLYVIGGLKNTVAMREEYGFFASETSWGVHPLATRNIIKQIGKLRANDPESIIILYPHWGQNYQWASDLMKSTSVRFLEAGADLIVGHGAHMLQELATSQHGSTVFSIGNFVFNSRGRYSSLNAPPFSMIARLTLSVHRDRWRATLKLYPIVSDNTVTDYRPRPVNNNEATDVMGILTEKSNDPAIFSQNYSLEQDSLGWHIAQTAPISPRLETTSAMSGRARRRFGRIFQRRRELGEIADSTADSEIISTSTPAPQSSASTRHLARYGPGSSHDCYRRALESRGIPHATATVSIRGTSRPAIRFTINDVAYVISAARIYLADEDGRVRGRPDTTAGKIVKRKDVLASLLRAQGASVPEGATFDQRHKNAALLYFKSLRSSFKDGFCVKPVDGGLGRHVYLGIKKADDFSDAFDAVTSSYDEVLVQEMIEGSVYRFLCVGGKVSAVRVGLPMSVQGDGMNTISKLVEEKNRVRRDNPIHRYYPLRIRERQVKLLADAGMTPGSVPAAGETVYLESTSNLHAGADIVDRTDDIHASYKSEVARAVHAVPNMLVCGADVIIKEPHTPAEPTNHGILELNTGPGIGGHHYPWSGKARDVAGDIIDHLMKV
jgi:D-alanine-D-alanine ligase-like ATP-grasp enzyme/poly-gamma-glutamate capsule biosynthesis protein CapA/YwtB (metallophosphatase superfamily)